MTTFPVESLSVRSPINAFEFTLIIAALEDAGLDPQADIDWSNQCGPPKTAEDFAAEVIFVICNSGMKNTVARKIYERVMIALKHRRSAHEVFGHKGKCSAMDRIWADRHVLYSECLNAMVAGPGAEFVEWCGRLPWIGKITKYHVAKNFGAQVAKSDLHLQRLANLVRCTPQQMCMRLAFETGYKIATVDVLLWRACANGILNSKTGELRR